jgi:hypothetical protein
MHKVKVEIYPLRVEPIFWEVDVPDGFEQMTYDDQNQVMQEILEEYRTVELDYWDYI